MDISNSELPITSTESVYHYKNQDEKVCCMKIIDYITLITDLTPRTKNVSWEIVPNKKSKYSHPN